MLIRAFFFLLDSLAGFMSALLLLRFFMQLLRVSFTNPVGAFTLQLTNWLVLPLRRILPGLAGLDLASLVPAYLLQILMPAAMLALGGAIRMTSPEGMLVLVLGQALWATLRLTVYLMIWALVLQAVLSWVNPYSAIAQPLNQFTRPLLAPLRRIIPQVGMFDLTPLVAILLLQLILIFL